MEVHVIRLNKLKDRVSYIGWNVIKRRNYWINSNVKTSILNVLKLLEIYNSFPYLEHMSHSLQSYLVDFKTYFNSKIELIFCWFRNGLGFFLEHILIPFMIWKQIYYLNLQKYIHVQKLNFMKKLILIQIYLENFLKN